MPLLNEALSRVDGIVRSHLTFDPKASTPRFTLACTDAHHFHDVPRIAHAFGLALPLSELRIVLPDFMESSAGLQSGDIDAALVPLPAIPVGHIVDRHTQGDESTDEQARPCWATPSA